MEEVGGGVEDGMVDQVGSITMEHGPKQYSTTRHQTLDWTETFYLLGLKHTDKQNLIKNHLAKVRSHHAHLRRRDCTQLILAEKCTVNTAPVSTCDEASPQPRF